MRLNNVTAMTSRAQKMKKYGRYGDDQMAHVQTGEVVVPHSAQTPEVINTLQKGFAEAGLPMERYTVGRGNSRNPKTKKDEYFDWGSIVEFAAPIVKDAGSAILKGIAGSGSEGGTSEGSPTPPMSSSVPSSPFSDAMAATNAAPSITYNPIPLLSNGVSNMQPNNLSNVMPPRRSRNPFTGNQEFYDMSAYRESKPMASGSYNPSTGKQEFNDPNQIVGTGLTRAQTQAAKRAAGYTGAFDGSFAKTAAADPVMYAKYLKELSKASPTAKSVTDLDPVTPGIQNWNKSVKEVVAKDLGWSGGVDQGRFGSGIKGVDYLDLNPDKLQEFSNIRKVTDPNWSYDAKRKDVLPSDFNAQQYISNNPGVATRIGEKYTSPGQHYYAVGQEAGLSYAKPKEPDWYQEIKQQLSDITSQAVTPPAPSTPSPSQETPTSGSNLNTNQVSSLTPVRAPRFRSPRVAGTYARSF